MNTDNAITSVKIRGPYFCGVQLPGLITYGYLGYLPVEGIERIVYVAKN